MNGFGFNSNGFVRQFFDKPIATYTHTDNKEVVVSAVDVVTGIFTSVEHGLVAGDRINPIINLDAGNIYPIDVYTGGLTSMMSCYVIAEGLTPNTFKLSATAGGTAISLSPNANMDLTKWHFEKSGQIIQITGLPSLSRYRLRIKGRETDVGATPSVQPNSTGYNTEWVIIGSTTYDRRPILMGVKGDIGINLDIIIDYSQLLTIHYIGNILKSDTNVAVALSTVNNAIVCPKYYNDVITSVTMQYWYVANGTVVEVYRA